MARPDTPLRAVLFDAVGTLIELRETVGETYARMARQQGVEIAPWRLGDAFARIVSNAPAMLFPDVPVEEVAERERAWWRAIVRGTLRAADSATAVPEFETYFDALFAHYGSAAAWRPREGAWACLETLRAQGIATGVVSNFDLRLPPLLADLELAAALDVIVVPAHVGAAKPHPAPFERALAQLGCPRDAAAYVGDDPARDDAGARAAGLRAIPVGELATLAELPARLAGPME